MSRNNTLQNALLISGAIIDDALAAEIATLNAEEEGEEKRHIMPPEQLSKYLPQWSKMPQNEQDIRNQTVTAPQKLTHPSTGGQLGTGDRGLHEPRNQNEASRAADVTADKATKLYGNTPSLSVTIPGALRRTRSGSFNPEAMDDFLTEISKWSPATLESQPSEQGSIR